jgi:hypothetical protein
VGFRHHSNILAWGVRFWWSAPLGALIGIFVSGTKPRSSERKCWRLAPSEVILAVALAIELLSPTDGRLFHRTIFVSGRPFLATPGGIE